MKTKILQRLLPFVLFSFIATYAISQTATVGNYVWKDINANGLQDEPLSYGINGVSVQLWNASTNTLVSSTTTTNDGLGNSGYYSFTVYSSNNYYIKFATNYGSLNLTTTNNAANVDGNSDADYYTGNSSIFYLDINGSGIAKNNNTIDAGYYCNSGSNSISFNSNSSVYGVPTSPALGFNIFLENNGTFSSSECEGAVAMGGNLNINGDYACTIFPYFNYQVGGVNIGLLVGGQVNYNGGNRFAVNNNGYVKIGNQNGSAAWYIDQSGNQTPMRVTPNSNYYGSPRIEMTATSNSLGVNATNNPIFQSNLIDFADAFNKMRSYSTAMSNYANTIILTDNNNNSISTVGANGQVKITLGTGINVLNINGSDMNNITNFAYTNQPDATHQLIINVNASGSFNWNTWLNGSIGGITNCKYVIYNFYNTTNLNIAGYNGVQGCIYAPFADITKTTNNGTIDGQVVGKSYLQTAGGEVHYAIFNATVASQQIANVCNGGNVTLTANNASSYWWSTGATTQSINVASVGVYSVTSTNSSGCSSTSTITVTGNQGSITSYSWYDANDNGLQDEPVANGINGSTVELWSVGADRIYGTADDALVSTAVSANNASGNPGYAVFYVCASGDYYLKYPLSASSYGLTSKAGYTGGAGDSDPNGTTGKTTVFTIDINGTGTLKDNNTLGAGYISNCTKPNAGADVSVCVNAVATLTGTSPTTGTWTQSSLNAAGATVSATTNGVATASFTVAGTYNFVYSNLSCRDTMQVVVKATTSSIINVSRCPSQMPYLWNGINRTTAGTYTYTTTNSQGCDSVATLNLTVKTNTTSTTNVSVCPSAMPYLWNGISRTTAGTYTYTTTNSQGCDSVATLNLTVKTNTTSTTNVSVCPSVMPYLWNGINRTTAGTYTYTTTNSQGCDSVATLNLTVKSNTTSTTNISICPSAMPYMWNGINRTTAGTYTFTTTNSQGCDSVATLNLTVKTNTTSTTNVSICPSAMPYLWNGINRTTAGTYTFTTTNSQGCDSVATLNLTVKTNTTSTTNVSICPSQLPYSWNGSRASAGTYTYTTTNSQGCDSVAILNLTVKTNTTSTTNVSICPSQLPYSWNGSRTAAGTYTYTTTNSQGCDSVATLNLTVKTNTTSTTNVSICPSQLPYNWNGSRTSAGTYTYTTTNSQGCDSVATLNLTVKTNTTSTTNVSICPSQLPYSWNGSRTAAGTYTYTTTNSQGCDSVATLNLTVKTNTTSATNVSICPSQLPYNWNGSRTSAGTYTYTTTNSQGCDSTATLILVIKTNTYSNTTISICPSQLPYSWNGSRTTAGTYTYTTTNSQGCDSVATLNLTVKTNTTSTTNVSICPSQLPYSWNGSRTAAGTYTYTTTNSQGCDSVATLNLTVKTNTTSTTNVSICPSQLPYNWNGSRTSAGTYTYTTTNSQGCDSTATLILVIKTNTYSNTTISICPSQLPYSWNGSRTTAGTYTYTTTNSQGCDSVATLNLTVKTNTASTTNVSVCPSQLPYSWNGSRTVAGTYTFTTTNSQGCDSVATLNLTVKTNTTSTTNVSICPSAMPYLWNGINRNITGTYTFTTTNSQGCDSVATLNLTVKTNTTSTTNVSICPSAMPYLWNGINRTTAGTYTFTTTNSQGCDSVATLNLTVKTNTTSTTNISVCAATLPFVWNGTSYSTSGNYTYTTANSQGCDSIATLNLTVTPSGSIGNYYWWDLDNNGLQNEPAKDGINGVMLYLYKDNGTGTMLLVDSTITANDVNGNPGYYNFTICNSGNYQVKFPTIYGGEILTVQTPAAGVDGNSDANVATGFSPIFTMNLLGTGLQVNNNTIDGGVDPCTQPCAGPNDTTCANSCVSIKGHSVFVGSWSALPTNPSGATLTSITTDSAVVCFSNSAAGIYYFVYTLTGGCSDTMNVTVNATTTSNTNVTICSTALPYTWNATNYNATGIYTKTFVNANGCDSVATLNLTVNNCLGSLGDYVWYDINRNGIQDNRINPLTNTVLGAELPVPNIKIYLLNATTNAKLDSTYTNTNGYYLFNNLVAGTYKIGIDTTTLPAHFAITIPNATSNDSIDNDVYPNLYTSDAVTLAANQHITTLDAGIYIHSTLSIVDPCACFNRYFNANQNREFIETLTVTSAPGEVWYVASHTGMKVLDSVSTAALPINTLLTPVVGNPSQYTIQFADENGIGYTGIFTNGKDTLTRSNLCYLPDLKITNTIDSICKTAATITLSAKVLLNNVDVTNGNITFYTATNWHNNNKLNDATLTPISTFNPANHNVGDTVTIAVIYTPNNVAECPIKKVFTIKIMDCNASIGNYVWLDVNQDGIQNEPTANGINGLKIYLYKETTPNVFVVVDSTITANDTANKPGYYLFNNLTNGNYKVKFPTSYLGNGLTTQDSSTTTDFNSDANKQTGFTTPFSINVTATGFLKNNITIDAGYLPCSKPSAGNDTAVCKGACITLYGTNTINGVWSQLSSNAADATVGSTTFGASTICFDSTTSGSYYFIYKVVTCTDTVKINIKQPTSSIVNANVCSNNVPYSWMGFNVSTPGDYTYHTYNAAGCDSAVTLHLTFKQPTTVTYDTVVSQRILPYVWHTANFNYADTITLHFTNSVGCDSLVVLQLRTLPVDTTIINDTLCSTTAPYTFNGTNYYGGTFNVFLTKTNGGDSLIILNLTDTCSTVTGGGGGGLESKSLGDVIAQRLYGNAVNSKLEVDGIKNGKLFTAPVVTLDGVGGVDLQSVTPKSLAGTDAAYVSTPTNLTNFTNIVDVFAVDYAKGKNVKAVVFGTKTLGSMYSHTKAVCDRLKGAKILEIKTIDVNGYGIIAYKIQQCTGEVEYAMNMTAGINNNDSIISLQNNWNVNNYQSYASMYNFQLWANSYVMVQNLAANIIAKLKSFSTVKTINSVDIPKVYIANGNRNNSVISLDINNTTAATTAVIQWKQKNVEGGIETNYSKQISLQPFATTTVQLNVGDSYEAVINLWVNNNAVDMMYLNDGTWAADYNTTKTTLRQFKVTNETSVTTATNEYKLLRNVSFTATTNDYVTAYKTIGSKCNALNLANYNSLKFNANATGASSVTITLISNNIQNWKDQYAYTQNLTTQQEYSINLNQFKSNLYNAAINSNNNNPITSVSFAFNNGRGVNSIMNVNLSNSAFSKQFKTETPEASSIVVYPNPLQQSTATVAFNSPSEDDVIIKVVDMLGKVVYTSQAFKAATGKMSHGIALNNMQNGIYIVQLISSQNSYTPTKLVVNR